MYGCNNVDEIKDDNIRSILKLKCGVINPYKGDGKLIVSKDKFIEVMIILIFIIIMIFLIYGSN